MGTISELMRIAFRTTGYAFAGGFVGLVVAIACEETGLVRYAWYLDSLEAGFRSMFSGAFTGGLLGFGWSVREWYRRTHPATEVEDELW